MGPNTCQEPEIAPVCRNAQAEENFRQAGRGLPMLTATQEPALAGPLTGSATVWWMDGTQVGLHCAK